MKQLNAGRPLLVAGVLLAALAVVGHGLERERTSGSVEAVADEETTEQTPVARLKPISDKDVTSGDDTDLNKEVTDVAGAEGAPSCHRIVCHFRCQLNGCLQSKCLDNGRCRCFCPSHVDPLSVFFSSLLNPHLEPGLVVRVRPLGFAGGSSGAEESTPTGTDSDSKEKDTADSAEDDATAVTAGRRYPSFALSHFGSSFFPDFTKFFENAGSSNAYTRILQTTQQTCRKPEDCSAACSNCTSTTCSDGLCRCTQCEDIEQRWLVPSADAGAEAAETCRSARNCIEQCKGCVVTSCRYGVCQCSKCEAAANPAAEGVDQTAQPSDDSLASSSGDATTASSVGSVTTDINQDASSATTEVLTVRTNGTLTDAEANAVADKRGRCIPKKCNHSCWERQCTRWKCDGDKCECDGCPEEISVVVKDSNSQPERLEDATGADGAADANKNKYEIIF